MAGERAHTWLLARGVEIQLKIDDRELAHSSSAAQSVIAENRSCSKSEIPPKLGDHVPFRFVVLQQIFQRRRLIVGAGLVSRDVRVNIDIVIDLGAGAAFEALAFLAQAWD